MMMSWTSWGVSEGFMEKINAATPATSGAEFEVPEAEE